MPEPIGVALRSGPGAVASASGVVLGRRSTGAGEVEQITYAQLLSAIAAQPLHASLTSLSTAAVELVGDYSDGTVLAAVVAILVTKGILTDSTTA